MRRRKTIRFVVLSDIHFALNHPRFGNVLIDRSETILRQAVLKIRDLPDLDFAVINGDAVNVPTAYDTERLREILDDLGMPYFVTPGNHDVPQPPGVSTLEKIEPALTKRQFLREIDSSGAMPENRTWWNAHPVDGFQFIGLDATFTGDWGGSISQAQLQWLGRTLKKSKYTVNVIFIHHALTHPWEEFGLDERYVVRNAPEVRRILEASNCVHAVISGHMHRSGFRKLNGISYFLLPSLTAYPCAYGLFTLTSGTIDYKMIQIDDPALIEESRSIRYEKENDIAPEKRIAWRKMTEGLRKKRISLSPV